MVSNIATHALKDFTFERFVVTRENQEAFDSCFDVARLTTHAGNPLFLYGPVGSGKTHLLHSVANFHRSKQPEDGRQVLLVTCQALKEDFFRALKEGQLEEFNTRYSGQDVLLVDDIQYLKSDIEVQQDFFKIFGNIVERGGRVVVTSDRPADKLEGLENRLIERFSEGTLINTQYPAHEARMQVLSTMSKDRGWVVPDDVISMLADRFSGNVRELKGGLTKVVAYARMSKRAPSPQLVNEILN